MMKARLSTIWGARCPSCGLAIDPATGDRRQALRALRAKHEEKAGTGRVDIDHWNNCLPAWELVEIKVTPPVGEKVHRPFSHIPRKM